MISSASSEMTLQFQHQLQDLGLDGDIERGGRLVGDQEARFAGQRHGDHGPLAHATRELVGIGAGTARGRRNADLIEHLHGALGSRTVREVLVQDERLADLVANAQDRIQGRHRLLEDHRDAIAPHVPPGGFVLG